MSDWQVFLPCSVLQCSIATSQLCTWYIVLIIHCGWWRWSLQRQQCEEVSDDPLLGPPPPFLPILGRVIFVERYETFCMMEVLNRSQRHTYFSQYFWRLYQICMWGGIAQFIDPYSRIGSDFCARRKEGSLLFRLFRSGDLSVQYL